MVIPKFWNVLTIKWKFSWVFYVLVTVLFNGGST